MNGKIVCCHCGSDMFDMVADDEPAIAEDPAVLMLYDSRARVSDVRYVHRFDDTLAGAEAAWQYVVGIEAPDEIDDYGSLKDCAVDGGRHNDEMATVCGVFNDYWAVYGWYLGRYDADGTVPHDATEVQNK